MSSGNGNGSGSDRELLEKILSILSDQQEKLDDQSEMLKQNVEDHKVIMDRLGQVESRMGNLEYRQKQIDGNVELLSHGVKESNQQVGIIARRCIVRQEAMRLMVDAVEKAGGNSNLRENVAQVLKDAG